MCFPSSRDSVTPFGDGIDTMLALDAQDQYNLTIIEPTFSIDPWYANNPNDANLQYETFMTTELEPWVQANLSTTGTEQNWLIGFSKSGIGAQDLILKHPDLFQLAASWDFPADMSSYDQFGSSSANNYGTDANFQANYRLTAAFLDAHKSPFLTNNRIWIGGVRRLPVRHARLRRALDIRGDCPHRGSVAADCPQVGQRLGPAGLGRSCTGQYPTALTLLRVDPCAPTCRPDALLLSQRGRGTRVTACHQRNASGQACDDGRLNPRRSHKHAGTIARACDDCQAGTRVHRPRRMSSASLATPSPGTAR